MYVADDLFSSRLSRVIVQYTLTRPRILVVFGIYLVFVPLAVAAGTHLAIAGLVAAVLLLILIGVFALTLPLRIRRRMRGWAFAGAAFGVGFGNKTITIKDPLSQTAIAYRAFRGVGLRQGFVFIFRARPSRLAVVLPADLFPGDSLEALKQRIAAANGVATS